MDSGIPAEELQSHELHRVRRAVLVADVVESVRLLHADEADAIRRWRRFVADLRAGVFERHGARLVKSLGDGLLVECAYPPRAVALAFEMQQRLAALDDDANASGRMLLRIGIHVSDVVADELDIYGSGVNLAARIAGVAAPGGVSASSEVVDELLPGIDAGIADGGLCWLKHFDEPVQLFHLSPPAAGGAREPGWAAAGRAELPGGGDGAGSVCVALVPFEILSGDAAQRTIAMLVGDMLLTRLSSVHHVRVISHLSSEQFGRRGLATERIAQLTRAAYLVCGHLYALGTRNLVVVSLVEARSGETVCAERFTFDPRELLAHDEAVTPAIAQFLVDHVVSDQLRRSACSPLPTLASETLQFAAVHLMHRQAQSDFTRAHDLLELLLERHPRAAAPHAWLAKWHVLRVTKGMALPGSLDAEGDRALWHTRQALDRNPDFAMSLAMEAFALCHMKKDLDAAARRLDEAQALNPSEPWVWLVRSTVESLLGHGAASWEAAMTAHALSPLDPVKHYYGALAASAAISAERFEDARRLAQLSLSKDARHLPTLRALVISQVHLGDLASARESMARLLRLDPAFTLARYIANAPRGGEQMRRRWAIALAEAGAP